MITGVSSLDPAFPTWGAMLGGMGYASYWFGKWHLTRSDRWWDELDGPPALARYGFEGGTFPSPNGSPGQGLAVDGAIAAQFEDWYAGSGGEGPWCTTVSFVNPHDIAWWWRATEALPAEASAPRTVGGLPANFETPAQLLARDKPRLQRSLQETSASSFGAVPFEGPGVASAWRPFLDLYVHLQRQVDSTSRASSRRSRAARRSPRTRSSSSPPTTASTARRTACAARAPRYMRRRSAYR